MRKTPLRCLPHGPIAVSTTGRASQYYTAPTFFKPPNYCPSLRVPSTNPNIFKLHKALSGTWANPPIQKLLNLKQPQVLIVHFLKSKALPRYSNRHKLSFWKEVPLCPWLWRTWHLWWSPWPWQCLPPPLLRSLHRPTRLWWTKQNNRYVN